MKVRHLVCLAVTTGGLVIAPVVTPVWAAPQPVKPTTRIQAIGGVDGPSLDSAPAAFNPAVVDSAGPAAAPRAAKTQRPAVLTPELSTGRFTAAGVRWAATGAPKGLVVQVRVREKGVWSDWQSLDSADGPDAKSADAQREQGIRATAPISSPSADGIQVRVDSEQSIPPPNLQLVTVDPGTSAADANLSGTPSATARSATTRPNIITRAQWGADESMRNCSPSYSPTIKAGFVHHTVGSNNYAPSDSAGIVRGIYAYHVNGNGWCDVGYNFLVDIYGQIFEGRAGGMDRPVIGAHAGGFNYNTFGVAAMGTFTTAAPPPAMLNSIAQVLGWKLGLHGRNPQARTVLTSGGGSYTQYPAGTQVPVGVVAGHRDVDLTSCPGDMLYAQLPNLRQQAASYAAANTSRDEDLYGALTAQTGSGKVEVHAQSRSSTYSSRMLDIATQWAQGRPQDWRFLVGSNMGDTRPDLIGIHAAGTASGRVEIKVASWASYYQDTTVNTVTPMGAFVPDSSWQIAVGGPSGGDVYFIALSGTGTGSVEVHSLTSESDYSQWGIHSGSALPTVYPSATTRFLVSKGSGDLYVILHGATGSGRSEVHALSASSRYQSFIMHAATPMGPTSDSAVQWVLGTAPVPDVNFVPLARTGSGAVEVHALSPTSYYSAWSLHAATNLPMLPYPTWQFSMG